MGVLFIQEQRNTETAEAQHESRKLTAFLWDEQTALVLYLDGVAAICHPSRKTLTEQNQQEEAIMECPECSQDLEVDIFWEESEIVCYGCGYFMDEKFESADDAFEYLEEN